MREEFNTLLVKMQALSAKGADNLTADETAKLKAGHARLQELKAQIERAKESQAAADALAGFTPRDGRTGNPELDAKGLGSPWVGAAKGFHGLRSTGVVAKAYLAHVKAGNVVDSAEVGVPVLDASPVTMGQPARGLLDVLPAEVVGGREYAYYRQITRTNNAAFVAPHGTKPTSVYGLDRVTARLRVLAHLSEPVDKYLLEDLSNVEQFISSELLYGLRAKLEDAIVSGDGVGENITGFANTSGIQTQAFTTDAILTARAALTKSELVEGDDASSFYIFHPSDWEKIETTRLESGQYLATTAGGAAPVDRMARRLWGSPVVLTVSEAVGTGYLVRQDAAVLMHDGKINIEWDKSQGFDKNEVKARCEGRFDLAVRKPSGIIKMALVGA